MPPEARLPLTSLSPDADRLASLKALFPEAFTEDKIDFDRLKQVLGGAIQTDRERYGLNWAGKTSAIHVLQSLSVGTLKPDREASVIKGQGRYPVPVILMARFAVDQSEQGKGLGKALLRDALRRALEGAEAIGGRAFLVPAKDEEARAYYQKFGMEASPTNPLHLFLLFKDIRHSLSQ